MISSVVSKWPLKTEQASPDSRTRYAPLTILLGRTIFAALLTLVILTSIPYGTVDPWWEAIFERALFALGVLWFLEGLLGGVWFVKAQRFVVPLLVLAGYAMLQTLPLDWWSVETVAGVATSRTLSSDPYETHLALLKFLALILSAALLLRYTSSQARLRALIYTVIAVSVLSAVFGILRQTTGDNVLDSVLPELKPGVGYGQYINRNHFAVLMEMSFGLIFGLVAGGGVKRERIVIYLAAVLPVIIALILSYSRGGVLAMLSQIIFIALMFSAMRFHSCKRRGPDGQSRWQSVFGSKIFRVGLCVCLLIVSTVSIVWVGGDPLVDRFQLVSNEVKPDTGSIGHLGGSRRQIWRTTWQLIKDHPVTGTGFGAYATAITEYHDASGQMALRQAHNDYLELFASTGLIGIALGAWFLARCVKGARMILRSADAFRRAACLGALAGLFGVAVHSIFDFGLHINSNALVAFALIVIATRSERPEATDAKRAANRPAIAIRYSKQVGRYFSALSKSISPLLKAQTISLYRNTFSDVLKGVRGRLAVSDRFYAARICSDVRRFTARLNFTHLGLTQANLFSKIYRIKRLGKSFVFSNAMMSLRKSYHYFLQRSRYFSLSAWSAKIIPNSPVRDHVLNVLAAILCLLICLFGLRDARDAGIARTLAEYSLSSNRVLAEADSPEMLVQPADLAVRYSPHDPEAHFARAVLLARTGQIEEAVQAARMAVALRPGDYFLWLRYGQNLELAGDIDAAVAAFQQAARRAPYYTLPAWHLGNLLLRTGQRDKAFAELRRAAERDPDRLPYITQLAWSAYDGDAAAVARALQPQTASGRNALAQFFTAHGKTVEAMRLFRAAGNEFIDIDQRALLEKLLAAGNFAEAYEVWSVASDVREEQRPLGQLIDGGFEGPVPLDKLGFGWRARGQGEAVTLSLDTAEPRAGVRSLRVNFGGNSSPSVEFLSQLVLVEPNTRYRLSFSARTREIITGGPPVVQVVKVTAAGDGVELIAVPPLPGGTTGGWHDYAVEFASPPGTTAVRVVLRRQDCPGSPCPAFGVLWLDAFALEKH